MFPLFSVCPELHRVAFTLEDESLWARQTQLNVGAFRYPRNFGESMPEVDFDGASLGFWKDAEPVPGLLGH